MRRFRHIVTSHVVDVVDGHWDKTQLKDETRGIGLNGAGQFKGLNANIQPIRHNLITLFDVSTKQFIA